MSVIINGRGVLSKHESNTEPIKDEEIKQFKPITIEEYRKLEFTPEQEWDEIYNPKRASIEALNNIEIKKRGQGPEKNIYKDSKNLSGGPYYDPECIHLHIWKSYKLIKNFIGEQNQTSRYIQYTTFKPGTYCSICHKRNLFSGLNWEKKPNNKKRSNEQMDVDGLCKDLKEVQLDSENMQIEDTLVEKKQKTEPNHVVINSNWYKILYKALYVSNNDKIVYNISRFKSLLLWPWELTFYQRFKLNNENYRDSCIFIKNEDLKFRDDYAIIV
jgi:hypothetical protein